MREKFIEFLKTNDLNKIAIELYEYFNEKTKIKMNLNEFLENFGKYVSSGGSIQHYIEEHMNKFKINCIIKNGQIINYY